VKRTIVVFIIGILTAGILGCQNNEQFVDKTSKKLAEYREEITPYIEVKDSDSCIACHTNCDIITTMYIPPVIEGGGGG